MRRARAPLRALLCLLALLGSWAFLGRAGGLAEVRPAPMAGMAMAGAHGGHGPGDAPIPDSDATHYGAHCPLCFLGGLDFGTSPLSALRAGVEVAQPPVLAGLDLPTAAPPVAQARAPPQS